jgi:hypothetical protein
MLVTCDTCAGAGEDAVTAAREAVHSQIVASQKPQTHVQDTSEDELSTLDERELEVDLLGTCCDSCTELCCLALKFHFYIVAFFYVNNRSRCAVYNMQAHFTRSCC